MKQQQSELSSNLPEIQLRPLQKSLSDGSKLFKRPQSQNFLCCIKPDYSKLECNKDLVKNQRIKTGYKTMSSTKLQKDLKEKIAYTKNLIDIQLQKIDKLSSNCN